MKQLRPSKEHHYLSRAHLEAEMATCKRMKCACIVVDKEGHILVSGYNGAPRGLPHCLEVDCIVHKDHCVRSLHDFTNAVAQAARTAVSLVGAEVYMTHRPCIRCVLLMIQVGISKCVYVGDYPSDPIEVAQQYAAEAGMRLEQNKSWRMSAGLKLTHVTHTASASQPLS